jgi:hypothetical protein
MIPLASFRNLSLTKESPEDLTGKSREVSAPRVGIAKRATPVRMGVDWIGVYLWAEQGPSPLLMVLASHTTDHMALPATRIPQSRLADPGSRIDLGRAPSRA